MATRKPTALYFTTVAVLEKDFAVLGGHLYAEEDEPSVTRLMICAGGTWMHLDDFDEVIYATTSKPGAAARRTLCLLGRTGHYREIVTRTPPADATLDTRRAGYLMDLRWIGTHLYACGGQNQVHRQDGATWTRMDRGLFAPLEGAVDRSLEAIDGFADDDIYAAGLNGEIWHWDGNRWAAVDSPTNANLYCLLCSSGGDVYVGGAGGLLFKRRRDQAWEELSNPDVTEDVLEDMTEFRGKIYVTATDVLAATDGTAPLEAVDVPVDGPKAYYAIDSVPEALWVVGDESVLQFDGSQWQRHVCPDNA